ncbi:hypothetical protein ACFVHQ_03390 [Actinomycetes bacterium NPDC127524]
MPKKNEAADGTAEEKEASGSGKEHTKNADNTSRLLGEVLTYLSDDEVEEIDIEYLLDHTEGLRDWWDQYRENNRKQIEEEIKNSLNKLPLNELESIREKIKQKTN